MPKLSPDVIEEKKLVIEDAAKALFIRQGFHATSMRDIAREAKVSLGNLYNYYETKESLFESIIAKYLDVINGRLQTIFTQTDAPLEPENLLAFGRAIGDMVNSHHDFWLLMYIDVLEFQNRHFRRLFEGLTKSMRRRFGKYFEKLTADGAVYEGTDPAVVFSAVYMQFFNYFLVEKLFGGNSHFGLKDDQVLKLLTDTFVRGTFKKPGARSKK